MHALQEDDIIGLLASDDIAQLKPLGDRILIAVSIQPTACCSQPRHRPSHAALHRSKRLRAGRKAASSCQQTPRTGQLLARWAS